MSRASSPPTLSTEELHAAMAEALALARAAAAQDEVPVGAVVLHEGKIIGKGSNRRECDDDPTAHAEIFAIRQAAQQLGDWRLVGCTLVVTLEPCPMCLAASQLARLERIVYGARDAKGGALSLGYKLNEDARTNHRFEVEHVETPECSAVLKEFFSAKRKSSS
jgi:tRNA(adenine34) deaminase